MDKIEEIKKLKELLDDGIITEEDFLAQKQKIFEFDHNSEKNNEKPTSLEEYEKQLMQEANATEPEELKEEKNDNAVFYEREKLKEKAKLDAYEELREERQQKRKQELNKVASSGNRILKWIIAVLCFIFTIGSFGTAAESGPIYIPLGIISLVWGIMACPPITDYTKKFEKYTKHKKTIVIALIIIYLILAGI